MADAKEDLIVDLPSEGEDITVEVAEEDFLEQPEGSIEVSSEEGEEHAAYSKKVQKRIDKLTHKVREAERQQQAAMDYA